MIEKTEFFASKVSFRGPYTSNIRNRPTVELITEFPVTTASPLFSVTAMCRSKAKNMRLLAS